MSDGKINIRDLSIKCGRCGEYQTLCSWEPGDGFNAYSFECEGGACDPSMSRTVLEVPAVLDLFYEAHPESACGGTCGTPRDESEVE
jgi:hypothetical protein